MNSWLAVSNAGAGSSDETVIEEALGALRHAADVEHVATKDPDDLARTLAEHPDVDLVVAMGGDGSLHAVVQALYDAGRLPGTAVGLVPLGTGNDFARTLELDEDPVLAARDLGAGTERDIDLIVDDHDIVVVNAAHVGIGAEAAARAEPVKWALGPLAYVLGALSTLFTRGADVHVTIDDRTLSGQVAQVAVGNGRFVGGGGELLPRAVIDDGLMDVAVAFAGRVPQRIAYALHLRRGTHPGADFVHYTRATSVKVVGEAVRCTTDGELTEMRTEHAWAVTPGGLRMRLPKTGSASRVS
ncbi:YegS/Rv2252/BmrU family lipid kinase [Aeromicrobium senzhongii]|uniref:YegS/Rv2252/BmrU family lipid kinase n=1 Tax=Aeromicrobium senzhongii TaxID=2663859 RepID=A0ABX6ST73_9ACTN|nr:YegS/Rv2252/BmrU family lipid kinase [Aeromicrobium senzhongii]MTB88425.1 YegS/Rv2252/BmrU family lipid kinase [Aeromicrobium senzhongii]QNL94609.1 YegS/Rv2252/BmrU family lipid kinase [Aeromicrobium senzhongii]